MNHPILDGCSREEQVNLLGPWVHGDFDLGNGMHITSPDPAQYRRLTWMRDALVGYLGAAGYENTAPNLRLLDVGCNAGFFTTELQRRFGFRQAVGIDPRERNIRKAQFVQQHLRVPGLEFRLGDVLSDDFAGGERFDVVLFLGVLYHVDNPILALRALRKVTNDLLLVETSILSVETPRLLPLWPQPRGFALLAIEYEQNINDGSAAHGGIVQWPTLGALRMLLEHVGFGRMEVLADARKSAEPASLAIVAARPSGTATASNEALNERLEAERRAREQKEWSDYLPVHVARFFFRALCMDAVDPLGGWPVRERLEGALYWRLYRSPYRIQRYVRAVTRRVLGRADPAAVFGRYRRAPRDRARYEYARALFANARYGEALQVLQPLFRGLCADWESVYRSYFLQSLVHRAQGADAAAARSLNKCLFANPYYSLAQDAAHEDDTRTAAPQGSAETSA